MSKELDEGQAAKMEKEREKLQAVIGVKKHEVEIKEAPTLRFEADEKPERESAKAKETKPAEVAGKSGTQSAVAKPTTKGAGEKPEQPKRPADAESSEPQRTASPAVAATEDDVWTSVQQAALEAALRQHPAAKYKENPNDRWDKIATLVPGKTKKQIKLRVKELAEAVKQKKAST